MKTLILMRHAKSDWKQPGLSDHDRPLNARGRAAAPVMARQLRSAGASVDVILASSAVRVQETIQGMLSEWQERPEVLTAPALYLASPQQIVAEVRGLNNDWNCVLVVAHNPGMAALVSHWAHQALEMPTAAVALFDCNCNSWLELNMGSDVSLRDYWKPRALMES